MAPRKKQKSIREELKKQVMVGADQEERNLADHFEEDDFDEAKDKRNIFVRHDALLRVAKQIWGIKSRRCNTIQPPTKENDWCAVVEVVYTFMAEKPKKDKGGKPKKDKGECRPEIEWSDVGDCRAKTANPGFKNYTTALAATRASSRALRFALGLEVCTQEEITDIDDLIDKTSGEPALDQQKTLIKDRMIKKHGKKKKKIFADLSEVVGEKVVTLDQLTRGQATDVLEQINTGD